MREELTAKLAAAASPGEDAEGLVPLDPFPAAAACLTSRRIAQLAWAFIVLGIVVRLIRYLLCFPLWPDESYLAWNYLDGGYPDLLKPLKFVQIAPLLYLWVQKTVVIVFGFSEYSLRFYSLACGIGSLLLFRHVAGRLLQGIAFLLAVGVFAVSYPLVRYSAEAKPYGPDVLVSLALLALAVEWLRRPRQSRWGWALIAAMPLAVLLSYPAVFVAGAISLTMAVVLLKQGSRWDWLRGPVQRGPGRRAGRRLRLLCRRADARFGRGGTKILCRGLSAARLAPGFGRLPLGQPHRRDGPLSDRRETRASLLTTICCATALVLLIRRRRLALAALFAVPLALQFVAAALHDYPYGGHERFFLYLGPVICMLVGLGAAAILSRFRSRRWSTPAPVMVTLALLVVIAVGTSVRDFFKPYKDKCFLRDRDFARWFWPEKSFHAELVCLQNDLHQRFYSPAEGDDLASIFFCNQRIYWRRRWAAEKSGACASGSPAPIRSVASASIPW